MSTSRFYNDNNSTRDFPTRGARKIRGACFDLSEDNRLRLLNFPFAHYVCYAKELCPTTGREHYQFYMVCKNHVRLSTLRDHIKDAGFYACDASHDANILYVLKQRDEDYEENEVDPDYNGNQDTFVERGERPSEKARAARTLDSLLECQNFYDATAQDMPQKLRAEWFGKICQVTDSLCDLMDVCDFGASSDEDEDFENPRKRIKTN
jgi:hypothetical protein